MNFTVTLILMPLSLWMFSVPVPMNATVTVVPNLPALCSPTSPLQIQGPATAEIICVNTQLKPAEVAGWIYVEPPPPIEPAPIYVPEVPVAAAAVGVAAAAGLSHLATNRREWLLVPLLPIISRIKKATADDPIRREILSQVERMGAATLSQIVKATGKTWGAVQWHIYVLEREGRLRSVRVGPFTYYFVNPKAAAEVILSSIDPSSLTLEDREKLDLLAAFAAG
ncbi:transcriptional regulator, ArsR family [Pyrobaculum sp. WP30]|nr:transcriptional regulator, ArsR family [Pyrobaculum sp. WP30]